MEVPEDSVPGENTPPPPPEKGLPGPPPGRTVPECAGLDLRMVPGSRNGAGPPPPEALEQVEPEEDLFKLRKLDDIAGGIWPWNKGLIYFSRERGSRNFGFDRLEIK